MASYLVPIALVIVGVIKLLPLWGALGAKQLSALYGVPVTDPSLEILLRHRAFLFGLVGAFSLAAAAEPRWYGIALTADTISVFSFLALAKAGGPYNEKIARVVLVDCIAAIAVGVGIAAHLCVYYMAKG
jgi:hypothetical protein